MSKVLKTHFHSQILELSKIIQNKILVAESEIALKNEHKQKFIEKLDLLMPGVKRKK